MKMSRIFLNINGVNRMFVFAPERDSLADVLRRYGLTGTKVGCDAGQCGACSVILNDKLVRSCRKKMSSVEEYSVIETIEGLGTPHNLHPLQQAWITYGGVQCGFCTPGFIMSAKALLNQNLSPTREEVRAWFQQHRNVCRCTGYKPLVDAVMAAARVLRGEVPMESIIYRNDGNGLYGTRCPRPAALAKVTGLCDYGDDIKLKMPPETLHLAIVQPRLSSHAKILGIDTGVAESMPGVVKVVTAQDVRGNNRIIVPITHERSSMNGMERPIIAEEKIFRYGDVVAVVAARTEVQAREAAKAVRVDIEPLPEYLNFLDAVAPDALRIHEESPNMFLMQPLFKGERAEDVIEASHCSVSGSFHTPRQPHMSVEGDIVQGYWDEHGNLTIHCKSQSIEWNRASMAQGIGVPMEKIRIIENPTGASFGWATSPGTFALVAVCAVALDTPVTLSLSWEEHQHYSGKRTPTYSNGRLACDSDGKMTAMEFDIGVDHGAYTEIAHELMDKIVRFMGYPYFIPNISGLCRIASTNHNFGTSYRGFGSVQAYSCSEALVDMLAEKMGMDPFEFRYKNVARPGDTSTSGALYKEYPMQALMDMMRPHYEKALQWTAEKTAEEHIRRGVGICCGGFTVTLGAFDRAEIDLELNPDGTITHYNTWEDQGQGGDIGTLTLTHEALKPLGIKPEQIRLMMNDSLVCPNTGIAAASRSHYMAGNATINAAKQLLDAMRKADGTYRTYEEMRDAGISTKYRGVYETTGTGTPIDPNTGQGDPAQAYTYGVFLSKVEVNMNTGKTRVVEHVVASDVGRIGNLLAVEGQAYGGISHTIGFALSEDYDDLKRHASIAGAGVPYIEDIPDHITLLFQETPRPLGPFGSSGCSELYQSSGHMSVINAINNAVGVRIYDLPARAEKVRRALEDKAAGKDMQPRKYFLGSDLYDALDELKANRI